ncbi:hypothetical protein BH10CYA1_BH10CYA1_52640 [soil metagenome]
MLALLQGCKHYVALTQAAQRFQIFWWHQDQSPVTLVKERSVVNILSDATGEFCSGIPRNHGQNVFVIEEWKSLE